MHGITAFSDAIDAIWKNQTFQLLQKPDIVQTINAVKQKYLEMQVCES